MMALFLGFKQLSRVKLFRQLSRISNKESLIKEPEMTLKRDESRRERNRRKVDDCYLLFKSVA